MTCDIRRPDAVTEIRYTAIIGNRTVDSSCDLLLDRHDTTYYPPDLKLLCTPIGTGIVDMLAYH